MSEAPRTRAGQLPTRAEQAEGWRAPGQDAGWLNPVTERFLLRLLVRKELEGKINNIVGVVTNGLFAARPADLLLLGTQDGVQTLTR